MCIVLLEEAVECKHAYEDQCSVVNENVCNTVQEIRGCRNTYDINILFDSDLV